ncbi:MAG TPA: sulfotransferase [Candidatus Limnocylindria bacterium]|nr:sulfotransferase [Candidatus Limnocylindria bacterium]
MYRRVSADAGAHDDFGVAHHRAGRLDEAVAAFRTALRCDPGYANAACNLGKVLVELGDLDEATIWFERAIELEPNNGSFYLALVTGSADPLRPAHLDAMVRLGGATETLPREQRIGLHFALGAVYERQGRVGAAFQHLAAGNALKRADVGYDEAATLAFLRATEATFGDPYLQRVSGGGDPSERPIFIFGMPRSGSTLVEQVLAAHPAVVTAGENGLFGTIVRRHWPEIRASTLTELRLGIRRIGEEYLRATDAMAANGARLTDKSLDNLQLVPLVHAALPNARSIHVRRDDLDTCFSAFGTAFAERQVPFSYDLAELGRYHRACAIMMERWRALVPPERLLVVDYERLVSDFVAEAQRIVAFCGLPWDPACLAFHEVRRPVRTASSVQVRQPLYASSVGRARRFLAYLTPLTAALRG